MYGGEERCVHGVCEKLTERDHLKDPGVEGRIILKWILQSAVGARTGLIRLRIGTGGGFL